ncbi:SagB/ThcOx family dehydrogenase [Clostridium algidicarnis]|uniref:SagB/ThcOx family dehydrogenase n=1 Tax=Clostridium algidicarnis TaxID=37659 RepID=UPI00056184CF|nr:SagB/ThcOx family dehydrogenase [Clostridium algidicarnis]
MKSRSKEKHLDKEVNPYENEYPYESDLLSFNTQYCAITPYADSTVLRTPDMVMKGTLFSKSNRFTSEEYLLNFRTNNNYIGFRAGLSTFFQAPAAITGANKAKGESLYNVIFLSKPKNVKAPIGMTIKQRRSIRNYSKNIMSEVELSSVLYYAQGVSGEEHITGIPAGPDSIKLKNVPSGGGLYPIELYVLINKVKGLEDGIYLYYPYSHSLKPIKIGIENNEAYNYAEFGAIKADDVNLIFFYVYNIYINTRKYGDAGMAYAFIEAGETAQNIQLISTALGYGACDIGGFEKQHIEKVLKIDGVTKHVIHTTVIGKEADLKDE